MLSRKGLVTVLGAFAFVASLLPGTASAGEVIKIGTLAPKQSVWGQVFQVWETAVRKKTSEDREGKNPKAEIQFFYNGQQGDEGAMVSKMKAGQLDGAAITAVGLSKIYKPILALQLPGALTTWEKLEKAQNSLKDEFEKGVKDAGFDLMGWGHVGRARLFLKGDGKVKSPSDLKSRKPYMWRDDIISPVFYQVVGATPVPLNVPEVLPNLKTGAVDTLNAPSLAVEQLQWAPQLNQAGEQVTGCAIGALVISSSRMKSLPGDVRTVILDTGALAAKALTTKIKDEDTAAYDRMTRKMSKFSVDEAEFAKTFKEVRKRLSQGTFSADLVKKIEEAGGVQ